MKEAKKSLVQLLREKFGDDLNGIDASDGRFVVRLLVDRRDDVPETWEGYPVTVEVVSV